MIRCVVVPVGLVLAFVLAVVMVAPEKELLQDEEGEDAEEDEGGGAPRILRRFEDVGQQVQEHGAQERAHGVAYERGHPASLHAESHRGGDREGERASGDAGDEDIQEHGTKPTRSR